MSASRVAVVQRVMILCTVGIRLNVFISESTLRRTMSDGLNGCGRKSEQLRNGNESKINTTDPFTDHVQPTDPKICAEFSFSTGTVVTSIYWAFIQLLSLFSEYLSVCVYLMEKQHDVNCRILTPLYVRSDGNNWRI